MVACIHFFLAGKHHFPFKTLIHAHTHTQTLTNTQSKGAIVTRLGAIEELAGMDMLCSDKTGTLTLNKMVIEPSDCAFFEPGEDYDSVVFQAALAAKWKEPPRDALDTMVLVVLSLPPLLHPSFPPA